jgi:hypothetical protein
MASELFVLTLYTRLINKSELFVLTLYTRLLSDSKGKPKRELTEVQEDRRRRSIQTISRNISFNPFVITIKRLALFGIPKYLFELLPYPPFIEVNLNPVMSFYDNGEPTRDAMLASRIGSPTPTPESMSSSSMSSKFKKIEPRLAIPNEEKFTPMKGAQFLELYEFTTERRLPHGGRYIG